MQIEKEGEQAFKYGKAVGATFYFNGMTLRDYFAGQAIIAVFRTFGYANSNLTAKHCYNIADAMIAERKSHVKQTP